MKYILIFALCMSTYLVLAPIVSILHKWGKEMEQEEEQSKDDQ